MYFPRNSPMEIGFKNNVLPLILNFYMYDMIVNSVKKDSIVHFLKIKFISIYQCFLHTLISYSNLGYVIFHECRLYIGSYTMAGKPIKTMEYLQIICNDLVF